MQYNYLAQVMNIGPTGQIFGNVKDIVFSGVFVIDTKTMFIQMKSFKIASIGHIDVTFAGNALADTLVNALLKVMTNTFKDQLRSVFSVQMKFFIQQAIDEQNRKSAENLNKQVAAKKEKKSKPAAIQSKAEEITPVEKTVEPPSIEGSANNDQEQTETN